MCEACGTSNHVSKARGLGVTVYTVKRHEPRCASVSGLMCDCDPELVPVAQADLLEQSATGLFDCATSRTPEE